MVSTKFQKMSDPVNLKNGKQCDKGFDETFSLKNVPPAGAHPDQGVDEKSDSSKNILEEVELEILLEEDLSASRVAEFEGIDTKQNVNTSSELEDKAIHPSQATGRPTDTWQGDGKTTTASHLNPGTPTKVTAELYISLCIKQTIKTVYNIVSLFFY